jgi:ABC-type dipeptide/oligopeptide/nickel transport system ATPase component
MTAAEPIIEIEGLEVEIHNQKHVSHILRGVSLTIATGEMHGLVGETGSGKSMTARAMMRLLPNGGVITAGQIRLRGRDLLTLSEAEMHDVRGSMIGMIFQNPRTALHPLLSVQAQMRNVISAHQKLSKAAKHDRIREYLALAGIPDTERVARAYPHELSGGMAQRVVIATVLVSQPVMLIADEPTTGLDATIQYQILEELADLQRRLNLSVLMITHDLGIVAQYCDSVSVMNHGLIVENGLKRQVLLEPRDPYTRQLLEASKLTDIGRTR